MTLKTTVECTTFNKVGFLPVNASYVVDGEIRITHVALYNTSDTLISIDEYDTKQFGSLSPETSYVLKTVYMDSEGEEVDGIIPDTSVSFTTHANTYYKPDVSATEDGISVSALSDNMWFPKKRSGGIQPGINGFGVGVELCDDAGTTVLKSSYDTPCTFDDLEPGDYVVRAFYWIGPETISARVRQGSVDNTAVSFTVEAEETPGDATERPFKDFWIAVGQPGAYSKDMVYDEVFGVKRRFHIKIKHAPFSVMPKIKNVVVQTWKDEDGDDVWLPRATGSQPGTYIPAITHEAVEYTAKFVVFNKADADGDFVMANSDIYGLIRAIEGRWLKIWDEYTQIGFEGAYLLDVDDDPKFKRRNYDYVEFELKFKINGTNIDAPFEGVGG